MLDCIGVVRASDRICKERAFSMKCVVMKLCGPIILEDNARMHCCSNYLFVGILLTNCKHSMGRSSVHDLPPS